MLCRKIKPFAYIAICVICTAFFAVTVRASEADGDRFAKEKQYRKAIEEYEKALKKAPRNEELIVKLARAYDAEKWYGRSVQHWENYLKEFSSGSYRDEAVRQAAAARRWIGVNFYNQGEDADKISRQLKKALEWNPKMFEAWYWLGRVYMEKGQFKEAIEALSKASEINPASKEAKWLLKETRGRLEQGDAAYRHYSAAYALYEKKDLDGALKEYGEATRENPKFVNAHFWIARIYMEKKQYAQAVASWNTVLKLEPGNKRAKWFHDVAVREMK